MRAVCGAPINYPRKSPVGTKHTNPEKYANHEGLTFRGWYYPRVVAGKSPVLHKPTLGWSRLVEEINDVGSEVSVRVSWLSLVSRIYILWAVLCYPLHLSTTNLMAPILARNWCDWKLTVKSAAKPRNKVVRRVRTNGRTLGVREFEEHDSNISSPHKVPWTCVPIRRSSRHRGHFYTTRLESPKENQFQYWTMLNK